MRSQVVKHKAYLVAKGYIQKQGVVFVPVARLESVCLFARNRDTSLLGGPPNGREIRVPEWRAEGDRICPTTTWLPGQRQP